MVRVQPVRGLVVRVQQPVRVLAVAITVVAARTITVAVNAVAMLAIVTRRVV